jgi:hypothetical protein
MAKEINPLKADSKNTNSATIDINQRFEKPLFVRIQRFKDEIGASTEQEAIRIAMTIFLTKNGF